MLTNIANHNSQPASGPVSMLEGCHVRIRHFLQLGRRLAENPSAPPGEIAEAAAAVYRYFNEALRLHEADENQTLFPRLQEASLPVPLRAAAQAMVEQHYAIDELVDELVHYCELIRGKPELLPSIAMQLAQVTAGLEEMFEAHMQMEETVIFPALAQLPAAELEAMAREMEERRRPPEEVHLVS